MEHEPTEKETVVTQVSLGGFDSDATVDELVEYIEDTIGLVCRCRLKSSWTPPESQPKFEITDVTRIERTDEYQKVLPHAFVHFVNPKAVNYAMDAAGRCELFFNNVPLKLSLGPDNPFRMNDRRRTTTPFKFPDVLVEIGSIVSRDDFFVGWKGAPSGVDFLVDPFDNTCKFCFQKDIAFAIKSTHRHAVMKCDFKVDFLVRDINEVKRYKDMSAMSVVVMFQLASSPRVWYRTADDKIQQSVPFELLDDDDPWIRTTDFTPSGTIGRCNTYRISIKPRHELKLNKAIDYLKRRRVLVMEEECPRNPLRVCDEPDFGVPMHDPFFCIQYKEGITFEILFLVNAVMHKGIFNHYQLSDRFFDLLRTQPKELNVAALKHLCFYKRPVLDAHKRLKLVQEWLLKNPKLYMKCKELGDIVEVRRLVITPTKAYCLPPEAELSNRVLRKYKEVADRFLRVTFMDEGMQKMNANVLNCYAAPIVKELTSNSFPQKTKIFGRVKSILTDGFYLCGRRYSFLAFSSNQLRDRSAWFFAEDSNIRVQSIKSWMGKFTISNVAKCAARMGQCFSSTYAGVEVPSEKVNEIPDIERNNYNFSDGIGIITPDLAMEVARKLKLESNPPSAYQIRYAGCKGVVACWPATRDGIQLSLRPSMNKFHSNHTTLEICSWTRFQPGFLNRQIITLLSSLDVPDCVFAEMQNNMVSNLNQMLVNVDVAFDVLTASCAEQGNAAAIMLSAGFLPGTEPHLRGMLTCIRAAQLSGLREKARIFVDKGRWLMGCFDELGVLEQGQCFIQVSTPSLKTCFAKHGSRFSDMKNDLEVIKGFVVIAKNPCLHPGDIRVLQAVDVPGLRHLYDCLIFPQKGDRPHSNEASGSDLDGDLYFVTWDENLIPPSKKSAMPMEYTSAEPKKWPRPVTQKDITDFFVKHMVNESLGTICNAIVVHADLSDYGAYDEKCVTLAELAALAVDVPKTGKVVSMPSHLKPKLYPDFMGKEDYISYKSDKILGRLYRSVKDAYDVSLSESSEPSVVPGHIPYDDELEVEGSVNFIDEAWEQKCSYDEQLDGLLGQYKVKREEEIVTGHVWSMPKHNSRKQGDLQEKLKHAYHGLKKEFRQFFEKMDTDFEELCDDDKNSKYEQKASAWYQVTYHPKWVKESRKLQELGDDDDQDRWVKLSFPWIAADYLARIKIRHRQGQRDGSAKPIDSLAAYLAQRL